MCLIIHITPVCGGCQVQLSEERTRQLWCAEAAAAQERGHGSSRGGSGPDSSPPSSQTSFVSSPSSLPSSSSSSVSSASFSSSFFGTCRGGARRRDHDWCLDECVACWREREAKMGRMELADFNVRRLGWHRLRRSSGKRGDDGELGSSSASSPSSSSSSFSSVSQRPDAVQGEGAALKEEGGGEEDGYDSSSSDDEPGYTW